MKSFTKVLISSAAGWMLTFPLAGAKQAQLILQTGTSSPASVISFAPGGRVLASISLDGSSLQIWDTASGTELRSLNPGSHTLCGTPSFVFLDEGDRIESLCSGIVTIWDAQTGRELESVLLKNDMRGVSILSPDGRWEAMFEDSAPAGKSIRISDARSGREMLTIEPPSGQSGKPSKSIADQVANQLRTFAAAAFSPDGSRLATWEPAFLHELSSTIRIWDVSTGREQSSIAVPETTSQLPLNVLQDRTLAFSPDGRSLALLVRSESSNTVQDSNAPSAQDFVRQKKVRNLKGLMELEKSMLSNAAEAGLTIKSRVAAWDVSSGRIVVNWETNSKVAYGQPPEHLSAAKALTFSGNNVLVAAIDDITVKWFDLSAGSEGNAWKAPAGVISLAADAAGSMIAVGGRNNGITLYALRTGHVLRALGGNAVPVVDAAFSPDGHRLSVGGYRAATIWDFTTGTNRPSIAMPESFGRQVFTYRELASIIEGGFFSADGRFMAAGSNTDPLVKVWNVNSGKEVASVALSPLKELQTGALGPDGRLLAVVEQLGDTPDARAAKGQEMVARSAAMMDQAANRGSRNSAAAGFSAIANNPPIRLIDVASGRDLRTLSVSGGVFFSGSPVNPSPLVFSPDGKILAAGGFVTSEGPQIEFWNTDSGALLPPISDQAFRMAFSPDGRSLATIGTSDTGSQAVLVVREWDLASRKDVLTVPLGRVFATVALAYSADGKSLAIGIVNTATANTDILIWDIAGGREISRASAPGVVRSVAFSPNTGLLACIGMDGRMRLLDTHTGESLAELITLNQGVDWLVMTPDGLFDGSPAAWSQIRWRFSENAFDIAPVESFFNEYYYPGLLSDIASGKRPKAAKDIADRDRRQPLVELSMASPAAVVPTHTAAVRVTIRQAAGGAQDVRLFRNGSLVKVWRGDVLRGQAETTLETVIPVVAGENRLSAYAFNHDNVKSVDATLTFRGDEMLKRRGIAHILAIGIDAYANPQFNLRYAAADARAVTEELKAQQERLALYERVEVVTLLNNQATRASILAAFERLAATVQPEDAVIVYYAGHGTTYQSHFYLIPHDLGYNGERAALDVGGLKTMLQHGISDADLEDLFEKIDAAVPILIIDACHSGQALEAEERRLGPMNSKGLAQLAYEKGMYILTAAQSYQAALEAAQLGHGYLTYTLISEGLKQAAADFEPKDGQILVREWFDYAAMRVPEMQRQKMREDRDLKISIVFVEGEEKIDDVDQRSVQRPRVFYRRELEDHPFVVGGASAVGINK